MPKSPSEAVRSLYDAFNSNDLEALREVIAPDVVAHLPGTAADAEHPPGTPRDREGWLGGWQLTQQFFPDMQAEVQQILETGDTVATRCVARGTHSVEFMGAAASGKEFAMTMLNMSRVVDGKIVEHWTISDNATMMAQLGIKLGL